LNEWEFLGNDCFTHAFFVAALLFLAT
jgi:hypothetical protein